MSPLLTAYLNYSVFWVTTRRQAVWKRRFGTSYRFHLQGLRFPAWTAWPFKIGPTGSPETSVSNHLKPRNNPEDGRIQFKSCGTSHCPLLPSQDWKSVNMNIKTSVTTKSRLIILRNRLKLTRVRDFERITSYKFWRRKCNKFYLWRHKSTLAHGTDHHSDIWQQNYHHLFELSASSEYVFKNVQLSWRWRQHVSPNIGAHLPHYTVS